jgi:tRNA dimethylallyltransferase
MHVDSDLLRECRFVCGPTACGKTALALELARRLDAEIIALDSMSLYRGMDVGTAKPAPHERATVPHHLIDVLEPYEEFSLAEYVRAAAEVCQQIRARGRTPLFVGGTGLYLRGILRGVFEGPPADWELRRELEHEARAQGPERLHARLSRIDPVTAARLHPHDLRRVVRALEVAHLTGLPLSCQQGQHPRPEAERPRHVDWLSPPRDWLHARINQRVVQMIDAGWVAEVHGLLNREQPLSRTARQALGYQELIAHCRGECSLDEAVTRIQTRTRQFAKRQHTWFRQLVECHEVRITGHETPAELADRLLGTQT